ncbi:MAG: DEAD/DEAH box helicase [Acidobacteriota bacterium]|nr:DEAD/DEAH box helicase [Acidobacteriota bacterium]
MSSESSSGLGFSDLGLIDSVLKALDDVGYETPSPIQAAMIPHVLAGRDVLGQAQTGTGKTAAFALPLLSRLDLKTRSPQVLVLTPTRELAIQVAEAFQSYASHIKGFHVLPIYGGSDYGGQLRGLARGVHVVVGTPGRVMDHMRRETLRLDHLSCLVLDEADEMLRMGFIDDVNWILEQTPENRQVALFSATMPEAIRVIAEKHLHEPEIVKIAVKTATADTIRQRFWVVSFSHKLDALTRILEVEPFDGMIIFVRTKNLTVELAEKLEARGFSSSALNGDIPQSQRERTVERLKNGKVDILVATDVAARGLDVERISHVINFDIPHDTEAYIHRIGRTGRAGRSGEAILFVAPREMRMLRAIERATNQRVEKMKLPTTDAVNDQRIARFKQRITDTLDAESKDLELFKQIIQQYSEEQNLPLEEIAAALALQIQGDEPLLMKDPPKQDRRDRPRRERLRVPKDAGMERYRIEVGRDHGVRPANIVGAIANETGLESRYIGRIDIRDQHSTVDLPSGMPPELLRHLKKVWVAGRRLDITRFDGPRPGWQQKRKPGYQPSKGSKVHGKPKSRTLNGNKDR